MSITESLTKIRMSALKEARNKFGFSTVWTADGKILYKEEGDTKTNILIDKVASMSCVTEKTRVFLF